MVQFSFLIVQSDIQIEPKIIKFGAVTIVCICCREAFFIDISYRFVFKNPISESLTLL